MNNEQHPNFTKHSFTSLEMAPIPASASTTSPVQSRRIFDVLIVGGGLSGLFVGHGLSRTLADWRLLEARSVLGGRLANDEQTRKIDMGGAWLWPRHQPHVQQFLSDNKATIQTFAQPDDPSSTRIEGGAIQLVHTLSENIDEGNIVLNTPVTHCRLNHLVENGAVSSESVVEVGTASNETFLARTVVFAVPPRLISKHVTFDPPLSKSKQAAMDASHTWMAGVTKVALVYANKFWDTQHSNGGLGSGGPAFQIYDSGPKDKSVSALTFFALVPPNSPAFKSDELLAQQVAQQMAQVWNYQGLSKYSNMAQSYMSYHVKRWSNETYISEDDSPTMVHPHPHPVRALSQPEWDGRLQFAGSESDLSSPGVMEGALGAAKRVLRALETRCRR